MKKLKMARAVTLTFEEGCNKYLENCRQRNLREGTIGHYRQSYTQFYKYFDPQMPIEDISSRDFPSVTALPQDRAKRRRTRAFPKIARPVERSCYTDDVP